MLQAFPWYNILVSDPPHTDQFVGQSQAISTIAATMRTPSDASSSEVSCCTTGGISQSIPDPRQPHREVGRASGERLLPMVL